MPVTPFVAHAVYDFTAPVTPARVRAPAPRRKGRKRRRAKPAPKSRGGVLTPQVVSLLDDRIEAALESGLIELHPDDMPCESLDFTLAELALLKLILLREAYTEPKKRPLGSRTAPGSDDRIAEYRRRAEAGESLYTDHDATAHRAHDKGLRTEQRRNGSGVKVLGWEE